MGPPACVDRAGVQGPRSVRAPQQADMSLDATTSSAWSWALISRPSLCETLLATQGLRNPWIPPAYPSSPGSPTRPRRCHWQRIATIRRLADRTADAARLWALRGAAAMPDKDAAVRAATTGSWPSDLRLFSVASANCGSVPGNRSMGEDVVTGLAGPGSRSILKARGSSARARSLRAGTSR